MKKTFKFMAMALAALVMAGVTVSCDPMDKDDDQQNEQTGGDQTGGENEDNVAFPTPEGKMWAYDAQDGSPFHSDFFRHDDSRLHILDNRIHAECIARDISLSQILDEIAFQLATIIFLNGIARKFDELLI